MSKFTKIEHNIHCSSHRYVMFNYVQLSQWWNLCIVVNLPWYSLSMWMIMSYVKPCRKYFWSRISSGASVNCGSCSISWMDCGHMSSKQQRWKLGTAKGYWRPLSRWPCLNNIGNRQFVMRMVKCSSISGWYWSTQPLEWDKTPGANERERERGVQQSRLWCRVRNTTTSGVDSNHINQPIHMPENIHLT